MSAGVISRHPSPPAEARTVSDQEAVCLWWVNLDWTDSAIASAWPELSPDERERVECYRRPVDRTRFIAARACLRRILSSYLAVAPGVVTFECGPYGKPRLTRDFATSDVHFNLAHSEELAVFAVAHGHELGVDLEQIQPNVRCLELARHFFAPEEHQSLEALATEDRIQAFYRCWTRKEAYVKAIGAGLSLPLDSLGVSLSDEHVPIYTHDSSRLPDGCALIDISPDPNFAAALAILDWAKIQPRIVQFSWR
jgi:4'-phosphopantetheinyl transferase